jgi:DNA-directed RNA polymerase delta subunit
MARDRDTGIVKPAAKVVDEQTKTIGAAASVAAAKAALSAQAAIDDSYYTKKDSQGKTQAQRYAFQNALKTAADIRENSTTKSAYVDPKTGKVVTMAKGTQSANGNNNSSGEDNNILTTSSTATLVSTETDAYGNVIGFYSDGTSKTLIASGNKYKSTVDVDAYTLLESTFKDFGLEELIPDIKSFMEAGLGSNQAALELKKTTAYITRFKGNETRRAAGLNVLSEGVYLELENSYNETLRAYGQQGFFGADRKTSQAKMAEIIGNDISAIEFKDRIDTVVTRVNNSDPGVKSTLKAFYNIGDQDLIAYFLSPKDNLPKLQEKVTSAEIGSEALKQNLITDVASASALARMGITKAQAREGYETISGVLPTASKLGQIYGEEGINYSQKTAEEEVFGQLDSAKRKRLRLAEKEVGSFSGTSGLARGALGSGKSSAF